MCVQLLFVLALVVFVFALCSAGTFVRIVESSREWDDEAKGIDERAGIGGREASETTERRRQSTRLADNTYVQSKYNTKGRASRSGSWSTLPSLASQLDSRDPRPGHDLRPPDDPVLVERARDLLRQAAVHAVPVAVLGRRARAAFEVRDGLARAGVCFGELRETARRSEMGEGKAQRSAARKRVKEQLRRTDLAEDGVDEAL